MSNGESSYIVLSKMLGATHMRRIDTMLSTWTPQQVLEQGGFAKFPIQVQAVVLVALEFRAEQLKEQRDAKNKKAGATISKHISRLTGNEEP